MSKMYNFSAFTNEFEIMTKLQNDFDGKLQELKPLDLPNISMLLDELESYMNSIDSEREKPIFI